MRRAFRIVAGAFAAFAIVFSVPFLIGSFVSEDEEIHLFHNIGGLAVYGVILGGGLLALAIAPDRNVATFQGLALGSLGALVGGLLSGDVISGFWFFPALVVVAEAARARRSARSIVVPTRITSLPARSASVMRSPLTLVPFFDPRSWTRSPSTSSSSAA